MRKCKKCQSTSVKTRTNYSHGKKSKSTTSFTCKNCGSSDLELIQTRGFRKRR